MKGGKVLRRIFAGVAAVAVVGGAGFGIYKAETSYPSVADGVTYVQNKDNLTNVHPVEQSFSITNHGCGKNLKPRTYEGTDKNGNDVKQTICVGIFHTIKKPWSLFN